MPRKSKQQERSEFIPADAGVILTPGETIKTLREINDLTQKDLAAETGIAQTTISAIESGRTKLGAERAKVFAEAFNVHPAVILFSDWRRSAA